MDDLYSKEGIGWVGSTCSCRGLYATVDREVVWSQKQELGFPRLIHQFRMTLLRDIRTCIKSWKFVSSRKLRFQNSCVMQDYTSCWYSELPWKLRQAAQKVHAGGPHMQKVPFYILK